MHKLSIGQAWEETRAILKRDGRLFLAVALAMFVLPGVVRDVVTPPVPQGEMPPAGPWMIVSLLALLALLIGLLAIIRLALESHLSVKDSILHGLRRFPSYFGASLLSSLPLLAIVAALIAPYQQAPETLPPGNALAVMAVLILYIFVSIRLILMPAVAANEPGGPITVIKRSWSLAAGRWWRLFAFAVVLGLAFGALILAIMAVVGTLLTIAFGKLEPYSVGALLQFLIIQIAVAVFLVFFGVMLARIYRQLAGADESVSVPHAP